MTPTRAGRTDHARKRAVRRTSDLWIRRGGQGVAEVRELPRRVRRHRAAAEVLAHQILDKTRQFELLRGRPCVGDLDAALHDRIVSADARRDVLVADANVRGRVAHVADLRSGDKAIQFRRRIRRHTVDGVEGGGDVGVLINLAVGQRGNAILILQHLRGREAIRGIGRIGDGDLAPSRRQTAGDVDAGGVAIEIELSDDILNQVLRRRRRRIIRKHRRGVARNQVLRMGRIGGQEQVIAGLVRGTASAGAVDLGFQGARRREGRGDLISQRARVVVRLEIRDDRHQRAGQIGRRGDADGHHRLRVRGCAGQAGERRAHQKFLESYRHGSFLLHCGARRQAVSGRCLVLT